MKYAYFPGCSLKSSGRAYEESFLAVCRELGIEMNELDDWNCCGATAYMSVDESYAYALSIRNLSLAERTGCQVVVPCGGCYGILLKAGEYFHKYPRIREVVNKGLANVGMVYGGTARVRHPIEVLAHDLPPKLLRSKVKRPLKGLKVACYYGCRILRPIAPFDDARNPQTMDGLLKGVGARVVDYAGKGKCCGGSLTGTLPPVALELVYTLLKDAERREADIVATACPLCQFNLECYQADIRRDHPDLKPTPVVYFTQLIGIAMGLDPQALGLHRQIVPVVPLLEEKGILPKPGRSETDEGGKGAGKESAS